MTGKNAETKESSCLANKPELVRLKKIEIFGFKSFADKTELEFNPGVTAVVGPNGCGKSNIADAFRWVLGEQSAKSMRGSKMPDVIFAGTTHRKPLNFAEVTITLCNECGLLPIEFSEVAVTRRLHRNGESDYFINRNQVRMKDIQSLFLDSGMGKNTFSIFEQGKIDQVINFSALERRYIFEEAAGILRFLQRKREALRKLEESDQNTARVKDIHKEEEKQIAVLQQQAEKARIFKENKAELEILEKSSYFRKFENLSKKREETKEKETGKKNDADAVKLELDEELKQLNLAKTDLVTSENILKTSNENYFKAKSEKEIKSLEKKTNQERLKEIAVKEKNLKNELEGISEKKKLRHGEYKNTLSRQKQIESEFSKEEQKLKIKRESLIVLEVEVNKLRDSQQATQAQVLKLMQLENAFESELKQHTVRFENCQERESAALTRKAKLESLILEFLDLVKDKKKELEQISDSIDGKKNVLFDLEDRLVLLAEQINETKQQCESSLSEIAELKARQKAIYRLKEDMEGFSSASKRLLQESKKTGNPLYQKITPLYELIKPKPGGEVALAAALKAYAQTLCVKEKIHFDEILAFAAKEKLENFSLICLENLESFNSDHSNFKNNAQNLTELVSKSELAEHFLKGTFVVNDDKQAFEFVRQAKNHKLQVFSFEGSFIDHHQVAFYGSESENNSFLREAELEALESKLHKLESNREDLEKSLKSKEMQKSQIQLERVELDKIIRKEEMKLVEVNFGLQRLNADSERHKIEMSQIETEVAALLKSKETLSALLVELRQKHIEAKLKNAEMQKTSSTLTEVLQEKSAIYKQEAADTQVMEASFQKVVDENRKLLHALNVFEIKDIESETQEKRILEEMESSGTMRDFILAKGEDFETSLEVLEKALQESANLCSKFEAEVKIRKNKISEFEKQIANSQIKLKKLETETHQTGLSLVETGSFLKSLESELQERYQLTFDDLKALNLPLEKSLEQIEKQIRLIKSQIDEAGDINMTSIEQLVKHESRYQFLNEQLDDLNHSSQELIQIITELDKESRKIFKETFEVIRLNFQKNFRILFNGGEADLEFTESGDILEAGIEISAKPPGKQMRSISLLSGGEKCLTAMALLFAIFEVRPAPFCILDEIDAPLDDSNVERFVNVVKQFIDRCQFIIITHNKRTMAIADVLFGVSMEEKGVSKLLSIEFNKS